MAKKWFSILAMTAVPAMLLSACGDAPTATVVLPTATTAAAVAPTATKARYGPAASAAMAGETPVQWCSTPGTTADVTLTGAGSTFVNPFMSKWSQEYTKALPEHQNQLPIHRLRRRAHPVYQ